ncbi:uncharacterized protein [Amphiura filiformis]|uniref:uncharacterized protein n=1 Tax=Amphiura filiformis TaxID=82378 RepID=UPI003B223AEA
MVTMLAEYGYHSHIATSPWSREETIFETDPSLPTFDDVQLEIQSIELSGGLEVESLAEQLSLFPDDDTCSMGTSHLSSEFDDDVSNQTPGEGSNIEMFGSDFLTNCFINNNFHEISVQDGVSTSSSSLDNCLEPVLELPVANNVDVVSDDGSSHGNSSSPSSSSSSPNLPRKRRRKLDDVPWSEMSYNERQTLLESVSATVSDVLGPREQLELLRIIDPDVESLPQDGQFTIEPDFLDNEKLKRIQKLIESHIANNQASKSGSTSPTCSSKQRLQVRGTPPKSAQKKKGSKERRNQLKALRQRQRREYKQNLKERKSGLFQKEEVLALQSFTEEEEVDILG